MRVIHKDGFFVGSYQIYHFIIAKNVCRCNCSALFPGVVAQSAQCGQDGPEGQRREGAHDKAQHQHHRRIVQRHGRGQDEPRAKQLADVVYQYEIGEVHWDMIDRTENREEEEKLTVTQVVLERYPYGKAMRVLQAADGRVEVLDDRFAKAIDSMLMNLEYEYEVQGPFINRKFPKQVYWKSEATTLTALLYDQDEMKEKDILDYLRDTKIEG